VSVSKLNEFELGVFQKALLAAWPVLIKAHIKEWECNRKQQGQRHPEGALDDMRKLEGYEDAASDAARAAMALVIEYRNFIQFQEDLP
jgi:hypothetical protein